LQHYRVSHRGSDSILQQATQMWLADAMVDPADIAGGAGGAGGTPLGSQTVQNVKCTSSEPAAVLRAHRFRCLGCPQTWGTLCTASAVDAAPS
jgi:hypothetical protein